MLGVSSTYAVGPETANLRGPKVMMNVRGTMISHLPRAAERWDRSAAQSETSESIFVRYGGASPRRQHYGFRWFWNVKHDFSRHSVIYCTVAKHRRYHSREKLLHAIAGSIQTWRNPWTEDSNSRRILLEHTIPSNILFIIVWAEIILAFGSIFLSSFSTEFLSWWSCVRWRRNVESFPKLSAAGSERGYSLTENLKKTTSNPERKK